MPRSYQVSMVRGSHDHHAHGAWSLKDRTETDYGSETRGRAVSTHILGLGIVLVGVLLLAIGLIMGLEFPKYVHEKYKENQCVVSPDLESYTSWISGTQWDRKVKIFYWTLSNVNASMYQGITPKFIERGPYVYTEKEEKEDISFAVTEVSYRLNRKYTFDKEATTRECKSCKEYDQLSIINPWYLQIMGLAGGENALAWSLIPKYVSAYLRQFGFVVIDEDIVSYSSNISALGSFTSGTPPPHQLEEPWAAFSFGAWLNTTRSTQYRTAILSERNEKPYTVSEVTALYRVFSNVTLLGGQALALPNVTLQTLCENWAQNVCSNAYVRLKSIGVPECGLYYLLKKCQSNNNVSSQVKDILQRAFCSPGEAGCLNVTGPTDDLLSAYKNVIFEFLLFLSGVVLDQAITSWDVSLVATRNQSELALGYDATGVAGDVRVPGLLQLKWKDPEHRVRPLWNVLTCLDERDMNNNMVMQEYNDMWSTPSQLLKNPNLAPSLSSFTDFATSCSSLRACGSCYSRPASIRFFMEDLLRPASFHFNFSSTISDVEVFNYTLNAEVFSSSDVYLVNGGLQAMTGMTGYTSWTGLPHTFGASTAHLELESTHKPGDTYVVVEPVTGRVWERRTQLQWNVAIRNESAFFQDRNFAAVDLPLPVYWWERSSVISSEEKDYYKHLVSRLLPVSCGGLVGFTVVAVLVAILGAIICVYPSKPNRVVPMIEDSSANLPNGKHL